MQFLIVDDDFGSRGGMAQTLQTSYPGSLILEAGSVKAALALLSAHPLVHLVLLDLNVEDSRGIDTLTAIKRWCENEDVNPRLVVVSGAGDYDDSLISDAIENCATGFITKGTSEEVFRSAIAITLAGSIFIPEGYLRSRLTKVRRRVPNEEVGIAFTAREEEVAALLVQGLTYKQIARRLEAPGRTMSDHTVRVHVQRMAWKIRTWDDLQSDDIPAKAIVLTHFANCPNDLRTKK